jgi:hypothetical protein
LAEAANLRPPPKFLKPGYPLAFNSIRQHLCLDVRNTANSP